MKIFPSGIIHLLPKSLYSRFIIIILLPVIIIQCVTIIIFYERHWKKVKNHLENNIANEIAVVFNIHNNCTIDIAQPLDLDYNIEQNKNFVKKYIIAEDLKVLKSKIEERLKIPIDIDYTKDKSEIEVTSLLNANKILKISFSSKRIKNSTTYIFVIWIVSTAVLFTIIALLFMRNQVKSILNLTKIVHNFTKGQVKELNPSGAQEIKFLGLSFLNMQKKITKNIKDRTELLTHIAHDLRTPLTKIKLKLALMKDDQNQDDIILKNIVKIEGMITSYLQYAKQEGNEESKKCDVIKILKDSIYLFDDKKIKLNCLVSEHYIYGKPLALERALSNIIENGLKYCDKILQITAKEDKDALKISIEDDGEGIPEEKYKTLFKPFHKEKGNGEGFGLGLSIAKNIINAHFGKIELGTSQFNGLKVIITFSK